MTDRSTDHPALAPRPFVDRPASDVAAATDAAIAAARRWDLPPPTLLRRGMNAIFEAADVVIRVGAPTAPMSASVELARTLLAHGIPVPEPVDRAIAHDSASGLTASGWRRIRPVPAPVDWRAVGSIVRRVHDLPVDAVSGGYPVADPRRFPWWDFDALLDDVGRDVDAPARHGIAAVVERHRVWRHLVGERPCVCHGDMHPGNVMMSGDGPVLLDWDLLCWANPAWDHGMLAGYARRWAGPPATYQAFVDGYGRSFDDTEVLAAVRDLRDVAATLMRVRAGRTDPEARAEASRRLEFYRGAKDPPVWRLQ